MVHNLINNSYFNNIISNAAHYNVTDLVVIVNFIKNKYDLH